MKNSQESMPQPESLEQKEQRLEKELADLLARVETVQYFIGADYGLDDGRNLKNLRKRITEVEKELATLQKPQS